MTWNWADCLIVFLAVMNIAVLVALVLAALKIVRGPVAGITGSVKALVPKGKMLAASGKHVFNENKRVAIAFIGQIGDLRQLMRVEAFIPSPEGAVVTVASVANALRMMRNVRSGITQSRSIVQSLRGRKLSGNGKMAAAESATVKPLVQRPPLLIRMGLVPPVARHLPTALRVIRLSKTVLSELRKRGVV